MNKWDSRFLNLAQHISQWSLDPSTKTGAVIVDEDNRIVSLGYNGFAKGVDDSEDRYNNRELKYKLIVHCERNALLFAQRSCKNCTLFTFPFQSCSACAAMVIQSGIKRCVAPVMPEHLKERWGEDMALAGRMFEEAGVILDLKHFEANIQKPVKYFSCCYFCNVYNNWMNAFKKLVCK